MSNNDDLSSHVTVRLHANQGDRAYDHQLERDVRLINARTITELGPLPAGGIVTVSKRRPVFPAREAAVVHLAEAAHTLQPAVSPNTTQTDASPAQSYDWSPTMRFIHVTDPSQMPKPVPNPWPLRFTSFTFGSDCWNTLTCSIIFDRYEHSVRLREPSGAPYADDWKNDWSGSFGFYRDFPPPVQVKWTSLDGVFHETEVDLDTIFKDRRVLHKLQQHEVKEGTAHDMNVDILLEVNDRTINVYMKAMVIGKELEDPSNPYSAPRFDLMLAWSNTY